MKQIDILRALPGPRDVRCALVCDEPLYQELVVLTALGLAEGKGQRGWPMHLFSGRLTDAGAARLAELERRERCDA